MGNDVDHHNDQQQIYTQGERRSRNYPATRRSFRQKLPAIQPIMIDVIEHAGKKAQKYWAFMLVVILPTFVMACYLLLFASPQYVSEAHFVVKGKSSTSSGGLGSLLEGTAKTSEDTYAVEDYMMSRDALHLLQQEIDIRAIYNRPYANYLAAFPSIFTRHDFESFYDYYQNHVLAEIDEETGISHLTVRSFSPQDSQLIATKLLDAGEKLVNSINDRQRRDKIAAAQKEVAETQKELHQAELALASYRQGNEVLDPTGQSKPIAAQEFQLENEISILEADKNQLDLLTPNSPLSSVYKQRIISLKAQLKASQSHMTGTDKRSFVPKLLGYDELMIQRDIIQKKLVAEITSLEVAKQAADRQMLFITVISQPNCPDYAEYPRTIIVLVITFISALLVYITGNLLISGAKEHSIQ